MKRTKDAPIATTTINQPTQTKVFNKDAPKTADSALAQLLFPKGRSTAQDRAKIAQTGHRPKLNPTVLQFARNAQLFELEIDVQGLWETFW